MLFEIYRAIVARDLKLILRSIKLSDQGVFVQASTLGSLEALLEFLKTSKIPVSFFNCFLTFEIFKFLRDVKKLFLIYTCPLLSLLFGDDYQYLVYLFSKNCAVSREFSRNCVSNNKGASGYRLVVVLMRCSHHFTLQVEAFCVFETFIPLTRDSKLL